jgi:hypothetical protein
MSVAPKVSNKLIQKRRTIEGHLLMGDFKETELRCRIHPPVGQPITCTFDEHRRNSVLAALTHYVRVVGESQEANGEILGLVITHIEILDREMGTSMNSDTAGSFFGTKTNLDVVAREQGVSVATNFDELLGDFWPEGESADEFIATVQRWRCEGHQRSSTP